MERNERILRQLIASAHGQYVYWDDGEMSDSSEWPHIDFLRDEPDVIRSKIQERNLKKFKMQQTEAGWSEP